MQALSVATPITAPVPRRKLAIVSTHPIQYYAPVFRALAASHLVTPRVFYTWSQGAEGTLFDPGFGTRLKWNVPLLDGYDYEFVPNTASRPDLNRFWGIRNPSLQRAIRGWGADALLVYAWNSSSHLAAMRHFKGRIPVFFRGDSTLLEPRPPLRAAARQVFLRWVYAHVDVAIAVGQNNRDYFAWCGVPRERIAFAPHSVDVRRFGDDDGSHAARAAAWRHELGIEDGAPVVLFAAKLIAIKEPLLLLDAFTRLGDTPAHLVFVGSGEQHDELRRRARGLHTVHFLPFQNQAAMPVVYRLADVYVLPSRSESWGLALNEAMASGRAVIASSRVGAARDLVRAGVNGWVFDAGSTDELAAVLRQAIACGRTGLARMGQEGERAIRSWSTEETARCIAEAVAG